MSNQKNIFIFADHIDNSVKGGGAQRSLVNFISSFKKTYRIFFISQEYLGKHGSFLNKWKRRLGVVGFYPSSDFVIICLFINISLRQKGAVFYLNGFYSKSGTLIPLILNFFLCRFRDSRLLIIAPRGGVSSGALSVKPLRKRFYLKCLVCFGLLRNVRFHVVSDLEAEDVAAALGKKYKKECVIAPNVVAEPLLRNGVSYSQKNDVLRVLYLARIHPIKNLMFMDKVLSLTRSNIVFDVFGFVDDDAYFKRCKSKIEKHGLRHAIQFNGPVDASLVREVFEQYDVYVLPTLGENFGHTIYESLSVGTPVLCSNNTMWSRVDFYGIFDISLQCPLDWAKQLDRLAAETHEKTRKIRAKSFQSACEWYVQQRYDERYHKLFE